MSFALPNKGIYVYNALFNTIVEEKVNDKVIYDSTIMTDKRDVIYITFNKYIIINF